MLGHACACEVLVSIEIGYLTDGDCTDVMHCDSEQESRAIGYASQLDG